MQDTIHIPWSEQQVAAFNARQRSGLTHPLTCGGQHAMAQTLIAERDGWHCPDESCDFRQTWAPAGMAEPLPVGPPTFPWLPSQMSLDPAGTEARRLRETLRETEDQLGQARVRIGELTAKLERERAHNEAQHCECYCDCDPEWAPDPTVEDVPVIGELL